MNCSIQNQKFGSSCKFKNIVLWVAIMLEKNLQKINIEGFTVLVKGLMEQKTAYLYRNLQALCFLISDKFLITFQEFFHAVFQNCRRRDEVGSKYNT